MSDLLNSASLVLIPSGYKEDTVYSVVPSDGSGDLSFTRASNGTRVNSAGLVEVCPWNLADNSENLTLWGSFATGGTITRTANYATAPNGTMTATRIQNSGGSVVQWTYQDINLINGGTISMYVKRTGSTNQTFRLFGNNGAEVSSNFTATSEWQRFEFTILPSGSTKPHGITTDSSANAADILVWGGQINIGSTAKPYFPTTDRLNVPRLTYQNGGGGCPSLLLEKQSTNYVLSSQNLTGYWNLSNTTATANSTTSPDGTQNASKLEDGTNNAQHRYFQAILSSLTNETLSFSIYAKQGTHRYISWGITDDSNYRGQVVVDLQTGTITDQFTANSTLSNLSVASQGNGWYRISGTISVSVNYAGGNAYAFGLMLDSSSWSTAGYTGTNTYCYLWGGQAEISSYPTSYIPTTSASATRVADACFKTGISSLIGQTEGTMFVDVTEEAKNDGRYMFLSDASFTNRIVIYQASGAINVYCSAGSSFNISYSPPAGRLKIAFVYKSNDYALWVNGVERTAVTTVSAVPTGLSATGIGSNEGSIGTAEPLDAGVNQAALFKTRLTNAELASLTTL
jgi:hypothetical protein